jgi:hypothetical protein
MAKIFSKLGFSLISSERRGKEGKRRRGENEKRRRRDRGIRGQGDENKL